MSVMSNTPAAEPDRQLEELRAALAAGNIKKAHQVRNQFLKASELPYPQDIQDRFQQLNAQLRELEDWQHFATNNKRRDLCTRMEALVEEQLDPEQRAAAIKELQDAWRQLGASDSGEGQRLWKRFKQAGDDAYAICAKFFDQKRQQREQNLVQREAICSTLEQFCEGVDWNSPDWKKVSQMLRRARNDWRKYSDIPHRKRKPVQKRYNTITKLISEKLSEEQENNHRRKRELIEEMKNLALGDQRTKATIQQAKQLQQAWKEVGITRRGTDQSLWLEFRAQCDAVFVPLTPVEATQDESASNQEHEVYQELIQRAELCHLAEQGAEDTSWPDQSVLDAEILTQLFTQYENAETCVIPDQEPARQLCIRLEMLAQIDSPVEDSEVRMQLQIEKLEQGLNQGLRDHRSDLEKLRELQQNFYLGGSVGPNLWQRFRSAESVVMERLKPSP